MKLHFHEGPEFPDLPFSPDLPDPREISGVADRPDARIFASGADGIMTGHVALWWRETPVLDGGPTGAVGGFMAGDVEVAKAILALAVERLGNFGCRKIVGPMNGNTWRRYRCVTESDGRGAFLLEPRNPPRYQDWWRAAGFRELASYSSSAVPLDGRPTVPARLKTRLLASGVVIRPLDPLRYEDELRAIYQVSLKSFAANFLYTSLEEDAFLGVYRKMESRVDPRLILIADRNGTACGFVFAIADLEAAGRGEKPALIVKTLAVDPESRCAGLGSVLVDEVQMAGHALGFATALHVMQFDDNSSRRITARHGGEIFRRYSLFSKLP